MKHRLFWPLAAGLLAAASPALAHEPSPAEQKAEEEKKRAEERRAAEEKAAEEKRPIEVTVRGGAPGGDAASRTTYGRRELELRPRLRPGDIVGAITGDAGLPADAIGKIDVFATRSYVAIRRKEADKALARLQAGKIKGRKLRVSRL